METNKVLQHRDGDRENDPSRVQGQETKESTPLLSIIPVFLGSRPNVYPVVPGLILRVEKDDCR